MVDDLGGYVFGALEPREAALVRLHLAQCSQCAREYADLAGLVALLDYAAAWRTGPSLQPDAALHSGVDGMR